jgi:hypothetical protein
VTSYTATSALNVGTVYYWEVHALTPSSNPGYGTWSSIFSFTTSSGSSGLPAPTLLAPTNGATGVSTLPAFSWSAVTGNDGYRILAAPSASGLPTDPSSDSCPTCVIDQTTSGTSYTATSALNVGTVYYWEVHALTPSSNPGYGTWSSIFSFTTNANEFYTGEFVIVSDPQGLNLHSCADITPTCPVIIAMPDGTVMQVVGGPTVADGYTWWELSGDVGGANYMGWADQEFLIPD